MHFGAMNALEDVPFQTLLGPLREEVELVTAPDVTVPDCHRILRETEVSFPSEQSHISVLKCLSVAVICLNVRSNRAHMLSLMQFRFNNV